MFWQLLIVLALLIPLLAIVLDSSVGKAMASRLERGRPDTDARRIVQRLRTLETEVDRLSTQVERLEEESDFLHELLAERSSGSPPEETPSSDPNPPANEGSLPATGEGSSLPSGDEGD